MKGRLKTRAVHLRAARQPVNRGVGVTATSAGAVSCSVDVEGDGLGESGTGVEDSVFIPSKYTPPDVAVN